MILLISDIFNNLSNLWVVWVKAPYPFCQSNLNIEYFFCLIQALLDILISSTISGKSWLTLYPMKIWIRSGIEPMASNLCLWFWIMPVMYISSSFFHSLFIKACRFLTAKTRWKWHCVYVFAIILLFRCSAPGWISMDCSVLQIWRCSAPIDQSWPRCVAPL